MSFKLSSAALFVALTFLLVCSGEESGDIIKEVFNPDDYNGIQRRYTIDVLPKKEECFFLSNLSERQKLNFHFMVKKLAGFC